MSKQRPFLTARWTDLLLLNFDVPPNELTPYLPVGTELDLFQGRAWVSVVGFMFRDTRLCGVPIPGHHAFEEVNLRFYVRRLVAGQWRPGVVFIREIVRRRAVAAVARWVYGENFCTCPMVHRHQFAGNTLGVGDLVQYAWQTTRGGVRRWNSIAARVGTPLGQPNSGSLTEFLIEHYWGYTAADRANRQVTYEYRVDHPPWHVADVTNVIWNCDPSAVYPAALARHLDRPPHSAFLVEGSAVAVFPKGVLRQEAARFVSQPAPLVSDPVGP